MNAGIQDAGIQDAGILESRMLGCWSISSQYPGMEPATEAAVTVDEAWDYGYEEHLRELLVWWDAYWSRSSVRLPDAVLEKQWYLEMYKFGAAARKGAPPISLQAVWTADNGKLPPWKGDFHLRFGIDLQLD